MMKSRKEALKKKLDGYYPNININTSEHGSSVKSAVEQAIWLHVKDVVNVILEDLYTTEEFEDDLGLNKPK
jgi:hypothetical protein